MKEWDRKNYARYRELKRVWRRTHPERVREHNRKRKLKLVGWTLELFDAANLAQGGKCAICGELCVTGNHLSADHDHKTGKPRGLLCLKHNVALGMFDDDPALLTAAITYLRKHK
jgi:hypothetical protein